MAQPEHDDNRSAVKSFAEQQAKKAGKKALKKLAKKGAQAAAKLALKVGAGVLKALLGILAGLGLPAVLVIAGSILLVLIIMIISSFMFSSGEGLDTESKALYEYMVQQSNNTVDMNRPEQRKYRVPVELLAAAIQVDVYTKEYENEEKKLIRLMATTLKPTFEYEEYEEWTETKSKVCTDGVCTPVSEPIKEDQYVEKITFVNAWNLNATYDYKEVISDWKEVVITRYETDTVTEKKQVTGLDDKGNKTTIEIDIETEIERKIETYTYTRTKRYEIEASTEKEDYSLFDQMLNSIGYGYKDKQLIESLYDLNGGPINYTNWLNSMGLGDSFIDFNGTIIPGGNVPAQYMPYYLDAAKTYNVDWYVLASLHFVETGFSTHPSMISSVGAVGHFQFMKKTWVGWNIGGGTRLGDLDIPDHILMDPSMIARYGGYGTDANNDGKADPWDIADSVHTAAKMLSANGYATDKRKAIWHYNRAEWYVDKVLKYAEQFHMAATYMPGGDVPPMTAGAFMRPTTGEITSLYGKRGGGHHNGVDIGKGGRTQDVPIVSVADGKVSRSYYSDTYGNVVYIRHEIEGVPYETVYAHMTGRAVSVGQEVQKGQFLGNMGNTGRSFGAHLHFEIHSPEWNSSKTYKLNPEFYIPF
ncbi:peptidoglycan DD-metalloendopeptidase family protein [Bacillus salitolerans]|uniref:Peptidoglycan DD-metalloendopeptidase family protein n=1 Tax=Bacillus salitolerans TaxID=1437434 RepID=A0ABW4LMF3_9BACI